MTWDNWQGWDEKSVSVSGVVIKIMRGGCDDVDLTINCGIEASFVISRCYQSVSLIQNSKSLYNQQVLLSWLDCTFYKYEYFFGSRLFSLPLGSRYSLFIMGWPLTILIPFVVTSIGTPFLKWAGLWQSDNLFICMYSIRRGKKYNKSQHGHYTNSSTHIVSLEK